MKGVKPEVLGTTLVVLVECAAVAQLSLALAYSQDWHDFVTQNETSDGTRALMVAVTLVSGALGAIATGAIGWLKPTWFPLIRRNSTRALPLLALWPLPPLLYPGVYGDRPFVVLSIAIAIALTLELTLKRSLPASVALLRGLRRPTRAYDIVAGISIALFCAWAMFASIRLHHKILSSNFDLGLFENLFWNALHGHTGFALDRAYFGEHATLFLYPMLPFYWLFPKTETLLVIQALLIGGAAVPLYLLCRHWLKPTLPALALTLAYLAYPSLHGPICYDFHFLSLSNFFVLWTAYFFVKRRWRLLAVSMFFALTCREDVALGLGLIAVSLAALRVKTRVSLILAGVAVVWFVGTKLVWMQQFMTDSFSQHYEHLLPKDAEGFRGVGMTLVSNPVFVLSTLATEQKLLLALHLLAPLVFLPVRRVKTLFFLLPGLVVVGLALSTSAIVEFKFHYMSHFIPYLFIASAIALAVERPVARCATTLSLIVASLVLTLQFGAFARRPYPASFRDVRFSWSAYDEQRLADLHEIIQKIPDDAKVAASEYEGPHVARRRVLRALKTGIGQADHILWGPEGLHRTGAESIQKVLEDHSFGVVATVGEFMLLKQGAPTKQNRRALRTLRRTGKLEHDDKRRM